MGGSFPEVLALAPDSAMPNSALPVLIYRGALPTGAFEALFTQHGWAGVWRNGVYDYDHYHSNAHEVLGIARGSALLQLGGMSGRKVDVTLGDCVVLPAGTGHRRLTRTPDFTVIGAYPAGQERYDICRTRSPEAELRISKVQLPLSDPVHGGSGPLLTLWARH